MKKFIAISIAAVLVLAISVILIMTSLFGGSREFQISVEEKQTEIVLRTVTMFGGSDPATQYYEEIKLKYEKENPNVIIEDESQSSDEEWKKQVAADFCSGNEPDVLQFFTDATANQLVAMDKFVTIEEIREVYPDYAKDTYDWALEQVANQDGEMRAVPTTGFWEGLYCNKDLFEEYDIPLPTDWDSFTFAIEKFNENGIVPVSVSLTNVPHYWLEHLLLFTAGNDGYTSTYTLATKTWIDGLSQFATLREMEAFPENTDTIDNNTAWDLFNKKEAAMILEGNWFLASVEDQENTVVIPFPGLATQRVEKNTVIGGMTTGFYITRRAWNNPEKREAAVKYVMAQTSKTAVQKYWENGGGTVIAATEVEPLEDKTPLAQSATEYLEQMEYRLLPTDSRMDPEAYKLLISGVVNISHGNSSRKLIDEALKIQNERDK